MCAMCGNCREREEGKLAVDVCSDNCIQVHNVRVCIHVNTNICHVTINGTRTLLPTCHAQACLCMCVGVLDARRGLAVSRVQVCL